MSSLSAPTPPLGGTDAATAAEEAAPSIAPPLGRRGQLRGRADMVEDLVGVLTGATGEPGVWVLTGLGGCGKTSVALEVAQKAKDLRIKVWWVSAVEQPSLIAGMRAVARAAGAGQDDFQDRNLGDVLWERLTGLECRWLLVIDNADDLRMLARDTDGTGWLRPSTGGGMVLVTSRQQDPDAWGRWVKLRRVPTLSATDGAAVLTDLAPGAGPVQDAHALSKRLEGLPLALRLAGSYLAQAADAFPWDDTDTVTTFAGYQAALEPRFEASLFADGSTTNLEERNRRSITATWEMSLDLLAARGLPESRPLLRLLACFGESPMPYPVLLEPSVLARSPLFRGLPKPRLGQLLRALRDVGLLDFHDDVTNDGAVVRTAVLHILVRATNRTHGDIPERFDAYRSLLVELLNHAVKDLEPEDPKTWGVWQALAPHCPSPFDLPGHASHPLSPQELSRLTEPTRRAARYLRATGLYAQAAADYLAVLEQQRQILGDKDPDTLKTRYRLAHVQDLRGQLAQAAAEYRAVLEQQRQILGDAHPDTLATRHSLASVLEQEGQYAQAEREYRAVLGLRRQKLGEAHHETLTTRHSLEAGGRHHEAEAETRAGAALQPHAQALGETHRDTLGTRHNLARLLEARGHYEAAEAELKTVLELRRHLLGEAHPDTLTTRHAHAYVLQALGRHDEAETEYRAVIDLHHQARGPEHPDTLGTRHNLARLLQARGQLPQAEAEYQAVFDLRRTVLSEAHPDTLGTRHAHAYVLQALGRHDEAEREYRAVIDLQRQARGPEHPDPLGPRHNLARLLEARDGQAP